MPNKYYSVTEEDVIHHAPILHKVIQDYYRAVARVSGHINNMAFAEEIISELQEVTGVKTEGNKYSPELLKDTEFRMAVIYHYSLSEASKVTLSWGDFLTIKDSVENEMESSRYESLSIDSRMIKELRIDPVTVPQEVISKSARLDEHNKAYDFIQKELKPLKHYKDGFMSYEEYFEYMKIEAGKIEKKCHINSFYGTHDIDRFACVCISHKVGLPHFDNLYKISDNEMDKKNSTEYIKNVQTQIISQLYM